MALTYFHFALIGALLNLYCSILVIKMGHFYDPLLHFAFQLFLENQQRQFKVYFLHFELFVFKFISISKTVLEFSHQFFVICFFVKQVLKLALREFISIFISLGFFYVKHFDLLLFINFSRNLTYFTVFSSNFIDCLMILLQLLCLFLEVPNY